MDRFVIVAYRFQGNTSRLIIFGVPRFTYVKPILQGLVILKIR